MLSVMANPGVGRHAYAATTDDETLLHVMQTYYAGRCMILFKGGAWHAASDHYCLNDPDLGRLWQLIEVREEALAVDAGDDGESVTILSRLPGPPPPPRPGSRDGNWS